MNVAEEASGLVHGPRQAAYGPPTENLRRIALNWSGILGYDVTPLQVALCMAGVKLVREGSTPGHRDNLADTCGYMLMAEMQHDLDAATPDDRQRIPSGRLRSVIARWTQRTQQTRRS